MIFLILTATLVACIFYISSEEISTREFFLLLGALIIPVIIIFAISKAPFPNDKYFQSGKLIQTQFHPFFVEQYQQPHTICHSCGKSTCCHTYYTTEYAKHQPYWSVKDSFDREWKISESEHYKMKYIFGNRKITTKPNKCTHGGHVHKGDPYLYTYNNETNSYEYPVNKMSLWFNPLKNSVSLFKSKTDYKMNYPKSLSNYLTNRLQGKTNISAKDWEIFNTKVYERTLANVIAIQLNTNEDANKLEDAWISGKQNDLIIVYTGDYKQPTFVKVFGWTKSSLVKYSLEQHILENGLQSSSLDEMLCIIVKYYEKYDFKKFNYLTTQPPLWAYIVTVIVSILIGFFLLEKFMNNYETKTKYDYRFWDRF